VPLWRKLILVWILIGAWAMPACAAVKTVRGAPQGFEKLDEPRFALISLSYGGEALGRFAVHFAPGVVQLDKPEAVIAALPNIKDKTHTLYALSRPLPAHAELLCTTKHQDNCGKLQPDVIGVIFDEDHLSAELFINKNDLSVTDETGDHFLPLPGDRSFSSIASFNGAINGTSGATPNFAFGNNSTFSSGEKRLDIQTTYANQGLRFDTLAGHDESQGWDASGGLFRSNPMALITDRDIAGVSYATSMRTWLDQYKTEGNDIIVYLPRRAFVSIYREGRLYSSRSYEAGNQRIDTSVLPDGAYNITLKIRDSDGSVREEQHFFAKHQEIPPTDAPIYYLQGGLIRAPAINDRTVPVITSNPILRAGTVRRIDDNLGLNLSLLGVSNRVFMESGLFWLRPSGQAEGTLLTSTHGDFGTQAGYLYNVGKWSADIDVRQLWMSNDNVPGFQNAVQTNTQGTATATYAASPTFNLGLRASYTKNENSPAITSAGPYAEWRIWQRNESILRLTANAANTGGRGEGSMLLYFSTRFGDYGVTATGGMDMGNGTDGALGSLRVWHDGSTPGNHEIEGAEISHDKDRRTISGDADLRGDFGQASGSVQDSFGQGQSMFSYGGNFSFNAAELADEFHLGGDENDKSAVIIETSGDADMPMKIFVNGIERSSVSVGDRQMIYLSPFHTYRIRIAPAKTGLVDYDAMERKVTLYPGNVVKLVWDANKFYVVAGRIVTPGGTALAGGVLQEGHAQTATDDTGRVQAELSAPHTMTFATADGGNCQVHLPDAAPVNGVLLYHDDLVCAPINQIASQ